MAEPRSTVPANGLLTEEGVRQISRAAEYESSKTPSDYPTDWSHQEWRDVVSLAGNWLRLREALKEIADYGHEMDGYELPPKNARKVARNALEGGNG